MEVGKIAFNPRVANAIMVIRDEVMNGQMWYEEYCKKDYECDELRDENARLEKLVEELLCKKNKRKK